MFVRSLSLAASFILVACSGASAPDSAADVSAAATAPTDAMRVLNAGGTFAFSLDESAPAATIRRMCAKESDPDACYAKVRTHGAQEKIKLAPDGAGHVVFSSFGPEDDGHVVVWIEVPLTLTAEGNNAAVGRQAGPDRGAWAKKVDGKVDRAVRFEVPDAATVVMIDPEKGRLVSHKES